MTTGEMTGEGEKGLQALPLKSPSMDLLQGWTWIPSIPAAATAAIVIYGGDAAAAAAAAAGS